jgi:hypothetical protein
MRGTDYVLVVLTFITGVFAGGYFYITVYEPSYGERPDVLSVADTAFLLSGESYGSCESTASCATFTLAANRRYEYVVEEQDDQVTGKMQTSDFEALLRIINGASLDSLDRASASCGEDVTNVLAYRYRLILAGEEYFFDTCSPTFAKSSLANELVATWTTVTVPSSELNNIFGDGLGHFFEREIDKRFQYDE